VRVDAAEHGDLACEESGWSQEFLSSRQVRAGWFHLKRADFSSNRHPALGYWWSMIFSRKPLHTFRDHALAASLSAVLDRRKQNRAAISVASKAFSLCVPQKKKPDPCGPGCSSCRPRPAITFQRGTAGCIAINAWEER
jgi:hypothetical protein